MLALTNLLGQLMLAETNSWRKQSIALNKFNQFQSLLTALLSLPIKFQYAIMTSS